MKPQRDMNVWGLLGIIQLFLSIGAQGTMVNQQALWQAGVLQVILRIAFHPAISAGVRAKSLETCGTIIRGNHSLQERFGDLAVHITEVNGPTTNGHSSPVVSEKQSKPTKATFREQNVIESLLELILEPAPLSLFDVRLTACSCMKAFIEGHAGIRAHVLRRAIEGHKSGEDAIPNMLTVLLEPPGARNNSDPYQQWMAAVLLLHVVYENVEIKALALSVTEGDAENGEEVVTFVQNITSNVIAGVQHVEDERALIGYLMLLIVWLFEDPDAVNDFLAEGSNVQGLIAAIKVASTSMPLVAGLCAFLLGIIYEFSTKDSPVQRATLHGLLTKNLGRETYVDRLTKLRESPFVRDFEVLPQTGSGSAGLPKVFFDKTFIDFLKDNFSRFLRAIDRDPNFEVSIVMNGVQRGVSRDLVDSLRAEIEEQKKSLETANAELLQLRRKLEQEELDHRRTRESTAAELSRIKQINQGLQDNHEEDTNRLQQEFARSRSLLVQSHEEELDRRKREHVTTFEAARKQHETEVQRFEQRLKLVEQEAARERTSLEERHKREMKDAETKARKSLEENTAEIEELNTTISKLHAQLKQSEDKRNHDLEAAQEEYKKKAVALEVRAKRAENRVQDLDSHLKRLQGDLDNEKAARKDVQTELEDLLVVFGDLEAKRSADKERLKALGEDVSEDEDEEEGDADAEEDDEDDEKDEGD
jgi:hypothetical protein